MIAAEIRGGLAPGSRPVVATPIPVDRRLALGFPGMVCGLPKPRVGDEQPSAAARTRSLAVLLTLAVLAATGPGCRSPEATAPFEEEAVDEVEPMPPDAAGVRDHGLNRSILGLWWGSGCPDFGACGCGGARDLAQEFTCQMDRLQTNDLPVSVYLFDGSPWSMRNSSVSSVCSGPDCCSWKLGDGVIQRLARDRVRGLVHYWGGCHSPDQYQRVQTRLGRNLLGFYLDDGSSDETLSIIAGFMKTAAPGNWETIANMRTSRRPGRPSLRGSPDRV